MVRRTKEDAEATRNRLLDAAEAVFHAKGVNGASLAEVAQAASLTRGAIYWHFKDKVDLFDAMMKRATLPFEAAWDPRSGCGAEALALQRILQVYQMVLNSVSADASTRRVFDIALFKVECVGDMLAVRERRLIGMKRFTLQIEEALQDAADEAGVALPMSAASAARGLHAIFDGVLQAWLLDDGKSFDLKEEGRAAVWVYLRGLGLCVPKEFV